MGTPDFSVAALQAVAAAHEVICAYAAPARGWARAEARPSPVQVAAEALGIEVRYPRSLKGGGASSVCGLGADVAVWLTG